jgi:hypothetical protein
MNTNFNPDNPNLKRLVVSNTGNTGGMLVGNRHSKKGIKAFNKSTGQYIEMEGGEAVITRDAVSDPNKREFNGEMLTNRQILSRINENGGGVAFAEEGMELPEHLNCCGASYEYGRKTLSDYDLLATINHEFNCSFDVDNFYGELNQLNERLCCDLECDGTTKIISYFLDENNFEHKTFIGEIIRTENNEITDSFGPHQWIEMSIGNEPIIIDFKSRIWMGEDAPQGINNKNNLENFYYKGEPFYIQPMTKKIMNLIQTHGTQEPSNI